MTGTCEIHWRPADKMNFGELEVLADHEVRRSELIRLDADRARFVSATVLLRRVVAERLGIEPRDVVLERRCETCGAEHGRPRVPGSGLFVSITHAGAVAGVAITDCADVGLDVEPLTDRDLLVLAASVLGPDEHAATSADLLRYWTRKEAVLKATGDGVGFVPDGAGLRGAGLRGAGLRGAGLNDAGLNDAGLNGAGLRGAGLGGVRVSPPERPPRLLAYPGRPMLEARMADLACRPGYVACVAVLTERELRFSEHWHHVPSH